MVTPPCGPDAQAPGSQCDGAEHGQRCQQGHRCLGHLVARCTAAGGDGVRLGNAVSAGVDDHLVSACPQGRHVELDLRAARWQRESHHRGRAADRCAVVAAERDRSDGEVGACWAGACHGGIEGVADARHGPHLQLQPAGVLTEAITFVVPVLARRLRDVPLTGLGVVTAIGERQAGGADRCGAEDDDGDQTGGTHGGPPGRDRLYSAVIGDLDPPS